MTWHLEALHDLIKGGGGGNIGADYIMSAVHPVGGGRLVEKEIPNPQQA